MKLLKSLLLAAAGLLIAGQGRPLRTVRMGREALPGQ